jgi:hypothetical protein
VLTSGAIGLADIMGTGEACDGVLDHRCEATRTPKPSATAGSPPKSALRNESRAVLVALVPARWRAPWVTALSPRVSASDLRTRSRSDADGRNAFRPLRSKVAAFGLNPCISSLSCLLLGGTA